VCNWRFTFSNGDVFAYLMYCGMATGEGPSSEQIIGRILNKKLFPQLGISTTSPHSYRHGYISGHYTICSKGSLNQTTDGLVSS